MNPKNASSANILYEFMNSANAEVIKEILSQFWLPTYELENQLHKQLVGVRLPLEIVVSGETKTISAYVITEQCILVITPFSPIATNVVLQDTIGEVGPTQSEHWHIFSAQPKLLARLRLPKVLLANPCVLENFPIPRLCLSIGLLASYLRKYQKANVKLVDMQLGNSIDDVVSHAIAYKPDMFGMSISYGQKYVSLSILEGIYSAKKRGLINPLVVLGNIIPASYPQEFLRLYSNVIIATGEGERTILDLIDFLKGEKPLSSIAGIAYFDSGAFVQNPNGSVPIDSIPLPALDTLPGLTKNRGALTLELSRGCQWNACTFCPRDHKSSTWKTFSSTQIIEQFGYLNEVCEAFKLNKHVFLADEEFVGGIKDGLETARIREVARGLIDKGYGFLFDAAARVDQVYTPKMNSQWHTERMEMWHLCRQAGLDRLFMGLESGSVSQLQRFGKGIRPEHSVYAIRILSSLGIPLRFGFVTFDQLMIGLDDLKRNIQFLKRTDALMQPIDVEEYGYERLFNLLLHDEDFISEHALGEPIHSRVSYMLASMEVLVHSRYQLLLKNAESQYGKKLILDEHYPDTNMGRYRVAFLDDLIGDVSVSSQKWIDRNFSVAYAVKSLYKVAPVDQRRYLMNWMTEYRNICLRLLKALVYIFDDSDIDGEDGYLNLETQQVADKIDYLRSLMVVDKGQPRQTTIEECMAVFEELVKYENLQLANMLNRGVIEDTDEKHLISALQRWDSNMGVWRLINDPDLSGGNKSESRN